MRSSDLGTRDEIRSSVVESGFEILPRAIPADRIIEIGAAYDALMASASGPDFRVGSTTDRLYLTERDVSLEDVYRSPPLLEATRHLLGDSFRLSALLARTLRPGSPAQKLHADIEMTSGDTPMAGFILMLDPFKRENGATRFVPGSHKWPELPSERCLDPSLKWETEVLACGDAGSMVVFHAGIWHGHTANATSSARRSIQGYFVRSSAGPR